MNNPFDLDRLQEIWVTITRNKSRSFLTAFGVFWGIMMLVVMAGSGAGLSNVVADETKGFAVNSCFMFSNRTTESYKGFSKGRRWQMTLDDVLVLQQQAKNVDVVAPMIFGRSSDNNVAFSDRYGTFSVKGLSAEQNKIEPMEILKGRYINQIDINERRKVCVIGTRVEEVMFSKGEEPIGQYIRVNGIFFQVIGVYNPLSGINFGSDPKETILLPYTTMQVAFNMGKEIHLLSFTAKPKVDVEDLENEVMPLIKQRHNIAPTDPGALRSINLSKQFKTFDMLFLGIEVLIWIVGLGTLLAGVIGVSNIMMVTVRERTKEIGIRRALGAHPSAIIGQIISESVVLTALAGFTGLSFGVGILYVVNVVVTTMPKTGDGQAFIKDPHISFGVGIAAALVLLLSGVLAGLIPAMRAMQIKAIDAIREE